MSAWASEAPVLGFRAFRVLGFDGVGLGFRGCSAPNLAIVKLCPDHDSVARWEKKMSPKPSQSR